MPAPSWEITPAELRRLRVALDRIGQLGGLDAALDALAGWALALIDASAILIALRDGGGESQVVRAAAGRGCRSLPGKTLEEATGSPGRRDARDWLRVPVVVDGADQGIVVARPRRGQRFQPGDGEILRLLAAQAALAIRQDQTTRENQVLYERERHRAEQLQAVADLTRQIVRLGRLGDLLAVTASTLKSRFGYDRVAIYLREDDRDAFVLRARAGAAGRRGDTLPLTADTPAVWAARSGEPQLVRQVAAQEPPDHAELAVPVVLEGRPIGVLSIISADPDGLDSGDLALAESIADDLALAIENLRLAARLRSDAAAAERARVARELHDDTAQQLVAIGRQLELIGARTEGDVAAKVGAVHDMVDQALGTVRRISRNLRPTLLDELGLVAAIEALVADQSRQGGPEIQLQVAGRARPLARPVEHALYRIAQEAVGNAVRHAAASHVDVRLRFGDPVVLEVADDGRGMAADRGLAELARGGGMGLVGMRERATDVGGQLEVDSRPERGTVVRASVPVA